MNYGRLFTQSWQLVWRHKFLWPLGLLLAMGNVLTAVLRFTYSPKITQFLTDFSKIADPAWINDPPLIVDPSWFANITGMDLDPFLVSDQYLTWLLGGTGVILILSLVFWLVWAAAQGAIITTVIDAEARQPVTVWRALNGGIALLDRFIAIDAIVFFPLFLLLLLLILLAAGLLFAFTWQMIQSASIDSAIMLIGVGLACLLPLTLLLLPLGTVISGFRTLAFRETAVRPQKARASIRLTRQVLMRNLGAILLVWMLLSGMKVLLGLLLNGLVVPMGGITAVFPEWGRWLGWLVGAATAVSLTLWHTFTAVVWTIVYQDLAK